MKILYILTLLTVLTACTATNVKPQLDEGIGSIPRVQFSDAKTIEEIRNLRPQAVPPLKVVVMPSNRWQGLTEEERNIIKSWKEKLQTLGFVESLEIIPTSLIPSCGYESDQDCFLNSSRAAGARLGADAILFLNDSSVTDSYVNPLSILNLTIVGMWIVPAHHRESYSVYEASLFDINNGYLYAFAEGNGTYKTLRPYMYVEHSTGQEEARAKALNDVGQKLYKLAQEQMLTAPNQ